GCRPLITNSPALLVSVVRSSPVAAFRAETCAPETTAPCGSLTSPLSTAVPSSCAPAPTTHPNRQTKTIKVAFTESPTETQTRKRPLNDSNEHDSELIQSCAAIY